jgi:hypothetical protein
MCQKSALQCQLTCLHTLSTVNPSPPPLTAMHMMLTHIVLYLTHIWEFTYIGSITVYNNTANFITVSAMKKMVFFVTVHLPVSRSNGERLYRLQQRNGGGGGRRVQSAIFVMISHKNRFVIHFCSFLRRLGVFLHCRNGEYKIEIENMVLISYSSPRTSLPFI